VRGEATVLIAQTLVILIAMVDYVRIDKWQTLDCEGTHGRIYTIYRVYKPYVRCSCWTVFEGDAASHAIPPHVPSQIVRGTSL
jgi:hypothetical protein